MSTKNIIREAITHELKCWPAPFQAVKRGEKTFEWRKDDRDYQVGDTLRLREWGPTIGHLTDAHRYTGDELHRRVTYIIREGFGIPPGYCIMALAELDREEGPVTLTEEMIRQLGDEHEANLIGFGQDPKIANVERIAYESGLLQAVTYYMAPPAPVDLSEIVNAGDAMHRGIKRYMQAVDIEASTADVVTDRWIAVTAKHRPP